MKWVILFVFLFTRWIGCKINDWKMYQLEEYEQKGAFCNDGSPFTYFIKRGENPTNKWNLYLMGGGWCYNNITCTNRDPKLKSSEGLNESYVEWIQIGIFDSDPKVNPTFHSFNHVFLYYCSSDNWGGSSKDENPLGMYFKGRNHIYNLIHELHTRQGMVEENLEVILSGSSAGGVGVVTQADYVNKVLNEVFPTDHSFKAIADSGLLWVRTPMQPSMPWVVSIMDQMKMGQALWNSTPNEQCVAKFKSSGDLWKCYFIEYNLLDIVVSDMFIFDDRFDLWQISENLGWYHIDLRHNQTQRKWAEEFGKYTLETVTNFFSKATPKKKYGGFISSCFNHCAVGGPQFLKFKIKNEKGKEQSIQETISKWYNEESDDVLLSQCNEIDCSVGCPSLPTSLML